MRIGNIGPALGIEVDVMGATLVIGAELGYQFQRLGIQNRDPIVVDICNKQVLAVRRRARAIDVE